MNKQVTRKRLGRPRKAKVEVLAPNNDLVEDTRLVRTNMRELSKLVKTKKYDRGYAKDLTKVNNSLVNAVKIEFMITRCDKAIPVARRIGSR